MYKRLFLLLGFIGLLSSLISSAAPISQSLALTPAEIAKLSQYFPSTDDGSEHVVWDKKPIEVVLPVGKERMLSFPGPVEIGINQKDLPADKLNIQNNNHTLYFTAKAPFSTQRMYVKLIENGTIILLDISAKAGAGTTPITIETLNNLAITTPDTKLKVALESKAESNPVTMVQLVRYAIQQLYAPTRLLSTNNRIFRVAMQAYPIEPLFLDGSTLAQPLASWRSDRYFVTAVLLRNQLSHEQTLDPRNLCGSWLAASFFPRNQLTNQGTPTDSTTVFLVSYRPFGETIRACRPQEVRHDQ